MIHTVTIRLAFPVSAEQLFGELTSLERYPMWNSGMISVSPAGPMREGMEFKTRSIVLGKENVSVVQVVSLVPERTIELRSQTGLVTFIAQYGLVAKGQAETELVCSLSFEPHGLAMTLAHTVVGSMAKARISGDLETLRAMLTAG